MNETFKQTCVFATALDVPGRIRYFDMQSGRRVVAELVDVDSADYQWTADDTGQRDLTWKIIDEVEQLERSPITLRLESHHEKWKDNSEFANSKP